MTTTVLHLVCTGSGTARHVKGRIVCIIILHFVHTSWDATRKPITNKPLSCSNDCIRCTRHADSNYREMKNCYWTLTCLWTESIGRILVIVFCGGTPAVPVIPAWGSTTIIFISLECEGELTRGSVSISTQCEKHYNTGDKYLWHF